jgi:hypothetical protein
MRKDTRHTGPVRSLNAPEGREGPQGKLREASAVSCREKQVPRETYLSTDSMSRRLSSVHENAPAALNPLCFQSLFCLFAWQRMARDDIVGAFFMSLPTKGQGSGVVGATGRVLVSE